MQNPYAIRVVLLAQPDSPSSRYSATMIAGVTLLSAEEINIPPLKLERKTLKTDVSHSKV